MFDDFLELIKTLARKFFSSRLAPLALLFSCMFIILVIKLFNLQIVQGENYLRDYIQLTEREVTTPGTRGNIYDRNGNVLAYNELAYVVTVQDNGEYANVNDRNAMLLRLVRILNSHGEEVVGRFEMAIDENGEKCTTPPHQRHPESGFSATSTDFAPSTSSPGRTEIIPPTSPPGSCLKTE